MPKWRNGRREGLKNLWAWPVWVRLPPSAPAKSGKSSDKTGSQQTTRSWQPTAQYDKLPIDVRHEIAEIVGAWRPDMDKDDVAKPIMHAVERCSINSEGSSE